SYPGTIASTLPPSGYGHSVIANVPHTLELKVTSRVAKVTKGVGGRRGSYGGIVVFFAPFSSIFYDQTRSRSWIA
ncbi:MAG: hypothetical protein PHZ00_03985, partial [Candidatus Peribacteraceae bacterium]|nr:hypothetical protein [Candidatus Peribacteraceae bacterium]